jgi:hypothetical protein
MAKKEDQAKKVKPKRARRVNNLRRSPDGLPMITPKDSKALSTRVDAPPTDDKTHLEREKMIEDVEILMLKGITTQTGIGEKLDILPKTAKKYMEVVEYRWALKGTGMRKVHLRGKARSRLEAITQELWDLHETSDSDNVQLAALGRLLEVHNQQMIVDGLTPAVLVQISSSDNSYAEDSYEETVDRFQKLSRLADKLSDYVDGDVVSTQ